MGNSCMVPLIEGAGPKARWAERQASLPWVMPWCCPVKTGCLAWPLLQVPVCKVSWHQGQPGLGTSLGETHLACPCPEENRCCQPGGFVQSGEDLCASLD